MRHICEEPTIDRWLPAVIAYMRQKLEPAGEEMARQAVGIACLTLRCKKPEGEALQAYILILADVPRDLLGNAIRTALGKETYHNLPTPGALAAAAQEQWRSRRDLLARAETQLWRLEYSRRFRPTSSVPRRPS